MPPTKEGLVHPIDSARLVAFGEALQREFSRPLKAKAIKSWKATNERKGFAASNVSKSGRKTYWATDDDVREATLTMTLKKPVSLYRLRLCEPIQLGQRIESFQVEALTKEGEWEGIATGTTIGPQRLLRLPEKEVQALRVTVSSASSCPLLSEVQFFLPPES